MKRQTFLICFTGIDGTGKTTQAKNLVSALKVKGITSRYVWNTYQPILTKPFLIIAKVLFFRNKDAFQNYIAYTDTKRGLFKNKLLAKAYECLVLFDYLCRSFIDIRLPLIFGRSVVSDRYVYDVVVNLAVDLGYSNKASRSLLSKLSRWLPKPDIAFLIDMSEETCYQRKTDVPSIEHLKWRRKIYLNIGKANGVVMLDGSVNIRELENIIRNKVEQALKSTTHLSRRTPV